MNSKTNWLICEENNPLSCQDTYFLWNYIQVKEKEKNITIYNNTILYIVQIAFKYFSQPVAVPTSCHDCSMSFSEE